MSYSDYDDELDMAPIYQPVPVAQPVYDEDLEKWGDYEDEDELDF